MTSQYQILGLLDVANTLPTVPDAGGRTLRPSWIFITTANTVVSSTVVTTATGWSVAVWQQIGLLRRATAPTPTTLSSASKHATCLNPSLYAALAVVLLLTPGRGRSTR